MADSSKGATFVLVHGAWSDGSIYTPVAEILRSKGHRVFTPTLTGVGRRAHLLTPDIDVSTHVEDIVNEIIFDDLTDVVLVGHSYGGMVIAGVADKIPERISSIVYLDAFLPEDGQALADLAVSPEITAMQREMWDRGVTAMPLPEQFKTAFEIPTEEMWRFTPQPLGTAVKPIHLTGAYKTIPKKTFVLAASFPSGFQHFYERLKDDPSWNTVSVPTGHMVQLEAPERCAEILEAAI